MTKKTDPGDVDLDAFAKPFALKPTDQSAESGGKDAVEYAVPAHVPPPRADHATFPNAPVIVNQTTPGVAPPANAFEVLPAERKQLEADLAERARDRKAREVATVPRRDPPGVATDPPLHPSPLPKALAVLVGVVALGIVVYVATHKPLDRHADGATTASATTTEVAPTPAKSIPLPPQSVVVPSATFTIAPTSTHPHVVPSTTINQATTAATTAAATTSDDPNISGTMRPPK